LRTGGGKAIVSTMTSDIASCLAPDEISPVHELNPKSTSPFFLTSDHYGRLIPRALGDLGVAASEWERHIAWDIGIAGVAERVSQALGAHLIAQRYSRLVIDCNRPLDVPSSIPDISEVTRIPGNEALPRDAVAQRQQSIFAPYHERITQALDARARDNRPTILISLHSFTPVYTGISRPWHIGTLYNRDSRLPRRLLDLLRAEPGLVVGDNQPYAVSDITDYTIPVHGEQRGLLHTGIEIRQDLITEETGQREWAERLVRLLRKLEPELVALTA
jgi:predicted N-formylglutamate amidohydrolase